MAEPFCLVPVEIADADGADLAFLKEVRKGAGGLFDRNEGIGPVQLIEIDVICLQPPQRGLDFLSDARRRGVAADSVAVPLEAAFRRDEDAPAAPVGSECPPDDLLGKAEAVGRRSVDQIGRASCRERVSYHV